MTRFFKKTHIPVIREPLDESQVVANFRRMSEIIDAIASSLFVEPHVELVVSQSGSTGTFKIEVTDPLLIVTNIEYNIMEGVSGFGGWATSWTSSIGTIGADIDLIRSKNLTLQEGHSATALGRVQYQDVDGELKYITVQHTFDFDNIAEVTIDSVSVIADVATIAVSGDEDTASIWRKVLGALDSTAVQVIVGRVGTFTLSVAEGQQKQWEVSGKNSSGNHGPWVRLDLDRVHSDKVLNLSFADLFSSAGYTIVGGAYVQPSAAATSTKLYTGFSLPQGATITELSANGYRDSASDTVVVKLYRMGHVSGSDPVVITILIATLTFTGTKWTNPAQALNESVQDLSYMLEVELNGNSAAANARMASMWLNYKSPDLETTL